MKRNIQEISAKIDQLAKQGCRLLSKEEKEKFFQECNVKRYYIKGKRKGEERDIYEVDGRCFNQIWKEIYPYVFVSCNRSNYYNSIEVEDSISEVKYMLFYVLQRFGPVFNNQSLSQRVPVIINMSLTNQSNKKSKILKTVSFNTEFVGNEENKENKLLEIEDTNNNMKYIDFWCDVPKRIRGFVERVISGSSINETQEFYNNKGIKKELLQIVSKI